MGNFSVDLKKGNFCEKRVAFLLKRRGNTILRFNNDKNFDFIYRTKEGEILTAEVKVDYMFEKTGNVAIEYKCNGKPSGVTASRADYWWYKLGDEYYPVELPVLRMKLIQGDYRRTWGGDNNLACMYLVPIKEFKKIFDSPLKY